MAYFKIKSERQTELIAKRRAIEEAFRYWDENEADYFVELEVSWLPSVPEPKRVTETILMRREVVSHYLKIESLWYWRQDDNNSLKLNRDEYLELWELLKANQEQKKSLGEFVKGLFNTKKDK
jgi:hypothetical protein